MCSSDLIASTDIVTTFRRSGYFNTFASSPVQAAAGLAVLDEIEGRNLLESVAETGAYLLAGVNALAVGCAAITDVRGCGLFLAIEWARDGEPDPVGAAEIAERLKDGGVLIANAGALDNLLKIRPPLVFAREHADQFLSVFAAVLDSWDGG